jgi:hypothetical protein
MASKRIAARLATVGAGMAMTGVLVGMTASPASAAISTGRIQVINQGSYSAFLAWQNTGGRTTQLVAPGAMATFNVPGSTGTVTVEGQQGAVLTFSIGGSFSDTSRSPGLKLVTTGTFATAGYHFISNN